MNHRVYNFGAGPAMLPEVILREAQEELLNWQNHGMAVFEIGHRTREFGTLIAQAEADLRELLSIPMHYHVLFLGGAARTQFAMIPMNLVHQHQKAAYLISGTWSLQAFEEASRLKSSYCLATSQQQGQFLSVPDDESWVIQRDTAYVYYTPNETIQGIRYPYVPSVGQVPLIADMTSCLLSEPINIEDYGLIFAGAQKNIAPAGLTIVIVRDDLLSVVQDAVVPTMLDYKTHATHHSLYATPPQFNCYLAAKMFQWLKQEGGIGARYAINQNKASKLYDYIDASSFYHASIKNPYRSLMNVCFTLSSAQLEGTFLEKAEQAQLCSLKGHKTIGGLRASLYNAMPMEGIDALIAFMQNFARDFG